MTNVLLLENPHPVATQIFEAKGMTVRSVNGSLDEDALIKALRDVQILGIRSKTEVSRKVLASSPSLEAIGAFCIGTNQIATSFAAERGVAVFNAPFSNTRSVVELAIGMIISLTRRMTVKNSVLHRGIWDKTAKNAHELRGRTLGLIGYGNIGTQLSVLAEAMGMRVVFYDTEEKLALGNAEPASSMAEVLRQSDVVSIHVDGAPQNAGLVGAEQFAQMKPGASFVNLSRGFVVDVDALKDALESGQIAGAAIDVFPEEPRANGEPFESPLQMMDNVILTPHIGGSTIEAQSSIGTFVAGKLTDFLAYGNTSMSVNLPNLTLPVSPTPVGRLCFMHHNVPGVMAKLNDVFAQDSVNVESQALATSGSSGYAITDVGSPLSKEMINLIKSSPASINVRYLPLGGPVQIP